MVFWYEEHTADVKIVCEADSFEEGLADMACAFTGVMTEDVVSEKQSFALRVVAESKEALLFEFLDHLVFLLDTEAFLPARLDAEIVVDADQWFLEGVVYGDSAGLYEVSGAVKAPTLHELFVSQNGSWTLRAVLDL
ncbi:MAG: archease [Candidatus Woesearchaeota archaeon]